MKLIETIRTKVHIADQVSTHLCPILFHKGVNSLLFMVEVIIPLEIAVLETRIVYRRHRRVSGSVQTTYKEVNFGGSPSVPLFSASACISMYIFHPLVAATPIARCTTYPCHDAHIIPTSNGHGHPHIIHLRRGLTRDGVHHSRHDAHVIILDHTGHD